MRVVSSGHDPERHRLVLRRAGAPVVVDGGELDVRAGDLLDELVRAAADRLARERVVADRPRCTSWARSSLRWRACATGTSG